jgi:hypothetical protein
LRISVKMDTYDDGDLDDDDLEAELQRELAALGEITVTPGSLPLLPSRRALSCVCVWQHSLVPTMPHLTVYMCVCVCLCLCA